MALLGRDLAPPRRRRHRGRRLLAVLVVLATAGAVYLVSARPGRSASPVAGLRPTPCPVASPPLAPVAAADVTVKVVNGTLRAHLARTVAVQLRRRGFRVRGVSNASRLVTTTTIRYRAADRAAARTLAEQLRGAALSPGVGRTVELDIGGDFTGLANPEQAAAARARDAAAASPPPRRGCTGASPVSR